MSNRPGGGVGNRPGGGVGNRPSSGDLGNFLGMPTQGGGVGGGNRGRGPASALGGIGAAGAAGAAGGLLGAGAGNRASQLPANRPGGSGMGDRGGIGDRGGVGDRGGIGDRGGVGDRGGIGNRGGVGDRGGVGNRGGIGDRGGVGDRGGIGNRGASQLPANRPQRGDRNGWNNYRNNRATNIRNISGNNINFNNFNHAGGWWGGGGYGHGFAHGWAASNRWHGWGGCWGWHGCAPGAWWGVATSAVALGSWCVGLAIDDDDDDIEYNYGDNVYIQNETVYMDDKPLASEDEYAAQAIQYASVEVPPPPPMPEDQTQATPDQDAAMQEFMDNWLPLGVFAVGRENEDNVSPRYFLQIAVSKDGYIAGTCFDSTNNQTVPITGSVDKASKRAAWKMADNNDVVMETGIFNLTQDSAPAMVHFGKDKSETRLLVRMEKPKDGQMTATTP